MRPFEVPARLPGATVLVDQCPHAFFIVDPPRDQDLQSIRERDQSSIEHPVCRAGKRKPVADDVGTILLDRSDMSGIDFRTATAVYQPKPRDRTSLAVGPQDRPAEDPVAQDARGQRTDTLPGLLELESPSCIQTCQFSCVEQGLFPVVLSGAKDSRQPRGQCSIVR